MWNPGDAVLLRFIHQDKVGGVIAATLVIVTPELVALYWAAGNPYKAVAADRNKSRALYQAGGDIVLVDTVWKSTDVLCLVKPGDSHATWLYRKQGEQKLAGLYINLQAPLTRTALGFDTADWTLDIVVGADLSQWWWKDEEDFAQAVDTGHFLAEQARSIRDEGNRVFEAIRDRRAPFDDTWQKWRPDDTWKTPAIAEGWEQLNP